jgi:hypothetical protein
MRFARQAPHPASIAGEFARQDLQRNRPVQFRILCEVNLTHAACAEFSYDAVMGNCFLRGRSLPNFLLFGRFSVASAIIDRVFVSAPARP